MQIALIEQDVAIKYVEHLREVNKYYHPHAKSDKYPLSEVIDALKRVPPAEKSIQIPKTICGYEARELLVFADACRKAGIEKEHMHEFALNAEHVYQYALSEIQRQFEEAILYGTGGDSNGRIKLGAGNGGSKLS